jgi:hypothetical protein
MASSGVNVWPLAMLEHKRLKRNANKKLGFMGVPDREEDDVPSL